MMPSVPGGNGGRNSKATALGGKFIWWRARRWLGGRNDILPGWIMYCIWWILFCLLLLFWNHTWITLIGKPVSFASCSRINRVGFGF